MTARDLTNGALWLFAELLDNLFVQRGRKRYGIDAMERVVYELEDRIATLERDRVLRGGRR